MIKGRSRHKILTKTGKGIINQGKGWIICEVLVNIGKTDMNVNMFIL